MENHISNHDLESLENEYQTQRTIEEVIDVETGEIVYAEEFFAQDEATIIRARAILEISIQSDIPKYKCLFCEQNIKISGRRVFERGKTVYFFAHFKDSDECPIKTGIGLGLKALLAQKYHGLKESELHHNLKTLIADRLQAETAIEKGVRDVFVEKTFKNLEISDNWRRPDVKAVFNDKSLVFELQLSTTFLSVVIGRDAFYCKHQTFIIWVFGIFTKEADWQKLMEKDIYYAHKRNIFLLDKEAKEASDEKGELVLHCYWQTPKIIDNKVRITWHKKLITLDELTYDNETYEVYYYNSDKDFYDIADPKEKEIIEHWEKAKEERWDKIRFNIEKREFSKEQQENNEKKLKLREKELLIKISNKEIIPTRFNKDGLWGYKVKNHIIIEPQYTSASAFKYGIAIVKDEDNDKYIIDFSGNIIINLGNVRIIDNISIYNETHFKLKIEEVFFQQVRHYEKMIAVKAQTEQIFSLDGEMYSLLEGFQEGKAKAQKNYLWGYIDDNLKEIIPCIYNKIEKFQKGKAKVQKNRLWGYIDEDGNEVISCIYSEMERSVNGKLKVKKNNLWGYIDIDGNEVIPCIYNNIDRGFMFQEVKAKVQKNNLWGYIDENGNELISCIYSEIESPINGTLKVKKNNLWGYIDENGNELISCIYDEVKNFISGKIKVKKDFKYGYIDEKGNTLIPMVFSEQLADEVANIKEINGGKIYESKNGGFIIPSLSYLKDKNILIFCNCLG